MKKLVKKAAALILTLAVLLCMAACGNPKTDTEEKTAASAPAEKAPAEVSSDQDVSRETAVSEKETEAADVLEEASYISEEPTVVPEEQDPEAKEETGSNILVVYFSRTGEQYVVGVIDKGNTAIVAEMIAEETGADLFEVLPEDDYYPMTYNELTDVAKQEQNENARPAYKGEVPDLAEYETVFIGAPVWWGDWPMIMYTFFEENADALAGKTLIPFSTHEGSGLSGFDRKLSSSCPEAEVSKGLAVRGNDAQNLQDSVRETVREWIAGLGY